MGNFQFTNSNKVTWQNLWYGKKIIHYRLLPAAFPNICTMREVVFRHSLWEEVCFGLQWYHRYSRPQDFVHMLLVPKVYIVQTKPNHVVAKHDYDIMIVVLSSPSQVLDNRSLTCFQNIGISWQTVCVRLPVAVCTFSLVLQANAYGDYWFLQRVAWITLERKGVTPKMSSKLLAKCEKFQGKIQLTSHQL